MEKSNLNKLFMSLKTLVFAPFATIIVLAFMLVGYVMNTVRASLTWGTTR